MNWETKLQNWCDITGASHAGAAALSTPLTWPQYEAWLQAGHHGAMKYLEDHAPYKKDPQAWVPGLQSAFVFAFPYVDHPEGPSPYLSARTAMYAKGRDYHHWMKERMQKVVEQLQTEFPEHHFYMHTDSSPILERDLAAKAGLGWFGKNTCLIHPKKGSLFLLGEILTSLKMETAATPLPDFCGTCTRCLEVCPTGALQKPRTLKADLCISYWTIESREIPPPELREKFGDWFFGCDLCQTVCPWNQKVFKNHNLQVEPRLALEPQKRTELIQELHELLTASHNQTLRKLKGTAFSRSGAKGLKRNALVVIANQKLIELRPQVESLKDEPYFAELAQWALEKLNELAP